MGFERDRILQINGYGNIPTMKKRENCIQISIWGRKMKTTQFQETDFKSFVFFTAEIEIQDLNSP